MDAEIIAVGSEITSGAKLDTNSQWLSLQLADLGITTRFHTTVADDLEAHVQVISIAMNRADLIVMTGGLGPTLDDLTREALAQAAETGLELDPESLREIERFFRSRGREMPARNRIQAMFPHGATPLPNPIGTAPGIWMSLRRKDGTVCEVAALPGVPSEMKKMYFEQVVPRLRAGQHVIRRARINCFGLGESHTEELLGDLTARGRDPEIGITAHDATITLRIVAHGTSEEECRRKIDQASQQIREKLGDYVFGVEDEELQDIVIREMNSRHLTFATLECGTCGLLAEHTASVDGAATCYRAGAVLPAMTDSPGVLAEKLRKETGADLVLYVGPESIESDADERPVSVIPIGVIGNGIESTSEVIRWSGNPDITRARAMKAALNLLRQVLKML
jgi:competence/damage-inducible protein CinA N-terminal domain